MALIRRECGRCGAEVRAGKRRHFCGEPYPLKATDDIRETRYIPEAEVERLREAHEQILVLSTPIAMQQVARKALRG